MSQEGSSGDEPGSSAAGTARPRERLRLLERAATQVGTTLDLFRTAAELADLAVSDFADLAVVELLDPVLRGEAPEPGPVDEPAAVRRAAVATSDGWDLGRVRGVGDARVLRFGSPYAQALTDLRPRLVRRLTPEDPWLRREPEIIRFAEEEGAQSLIAVPLTVRGVPLGVASFFRLGRARGFDEEDLAQAVGLASFGAVCLDNARRYAREKALARLVQRTLVPRRIPARVAAETAWTFLPVAAGGSWFDVVSVSGARIVCVVGEVAGHGMTAVSLMGQVSTAVSTLAAVDMAVDEILARVHDLVVTAETGRSTLSADGPRADGLGVGCVLALYDPVNGSCTVARAGGPAPTVVFPDGDTTVLDVPSGPPLGGQGAPSYPLSRFDLPDGSLLALHTASLTEPGPPLVRSLVAAGGDLHKASDSTLAEMFPEGPSEDTVLFLARTRVLGPDRTCSWTLANRPESVADARGLVSRQLTAWGLDELVPGTQLLASELVTNGVRYSTGEVELRIIMREHTLACEVTDCSNAAPTLRRAQDDDEGGRGLFLVSRLALDWGVRPTARGKTIWAEQLLPGHDKSDRDS
ncbi:ATP-binding SpoIIE family protein phosphatase [Actinacidiphila acidipaludis]|uniref:SpoIIE family protein phosphatase n=1 Tax=Actinacidiphila acidipaludis TaxID=2873382 RepID=A0ABS7Q991_9ACTN|nr:SpoIIE family protein phosphatase [Streptomyces acidipaludis]MBY8879696.1 SpoIIE family protein phosphatase [Streptomyces acidipaludis]